MYCVILAHIYGYSLTPVNEEEKGGLRLQAVCKERLRRNISNLYPKPSTKVFLNMMASKLTKTKDTRSSKR